MAGAPGRGRKGRGGGPPLPATPHDSLFRALLSDPERAAAFLRDHLPNDVAGLLDDAPPVPLEGSFVDETLARSQSDLLFRVRLKSGRDAFVYVLIEHKSCADPGVPLQMASYMIRVWKRHAGEDAAKLRALPPIIPIVLYHGRERWTVSSSLAAAIDSADEEALAFAQGFGHILRDIGQIPAEELSRHAALRAGLLVLKRQAMELLDAVLRDLPDDSELQRQAMEYIVRVYDGADLERLRSALQAAKQDRLEAFVGTIAETLIEQGKAEGEAKGMARGLAEGEAKSLARLLERRFGPLPRSARDRIAAAPLEQLDAWLDGVFDARSLDDLLGGAKPS